MARHEFSHWEPDPAALVGLDAVGARDLVVECFAAAQRESIAAAKGRLHLGADDKAVRRTAETAVRAAFAKAGRDYASPDVESLMRVVDNLLEQAAALGTPPEVMAHHRMQLLKVIRALDR